MKNTLKKLLILSGLIVCATSSFASPVNVVNNLNDPTHQKDGGIFLNADDFRIQYKNDSNTNFYYSNDQGAKDATTEHYQGNGSVSPHGHANFSTTLETSLTSKGAKRQVYLYIPIQSGVNNGRYKRVSFMVWTPHSGNPSWKLGTSNPGDPMDEDAYDFYNFHYEEDAGGNTGFFSGTKSWGVVQINLEQTGNNAYLKMITYRYSKIDDRWISNTQIIDTDRVQGKIVSLDEIQNRPSGSYTTSCEDYPDTDAWYNGSLLQRCRASNGSPHTTWLDYKKECAPGSTVSNDNGNLVCDQKRDGQLMATTVAIAKAPKGTYDFGQWKASEYPVVYSPKEIHPFVTYNGKGYVACNSDTTAKDVPGKSDAWKEVNGSLGNTCGVTIHSYKKQSTTPSVAKSAVSFW